MTNPLHKIISALLRNTNPAPTVPPAYKELTETIHFYHTTINQHLPYYTQLSKNGKLRFLKRVHYFKSSKTFHYTGMEPKPEIPVLVSAAAVQLTFGLRSYHLPFFKNIYILPDAYQTKEFNELVVGHVSVKGIFIAWKYFLKGFEDNKDGVNTALHEMAHALRHQNQLKEFGIDKEFKTDFSKYTRQYGPVLIQALLHRRSFLRGYAFTNFEEFWAVSVEAFFEHPEGLKKHLPKIYEALCEVLNQDPLAGEAA
ncbi:MAG TPA: zinc-dependent peptidase [Chitinophagaceae bacterium]|nr:zinc-dependent peptidase [Chitinophagaceae bacterium]